jgi:hypothetical protein
MDTYAVLSQLADPLLKTLVVIALVGAIIICIIKYCERK